MQVGEGPEDAPDGIADRWFWLTYDFDRRRRLRALAAFDAPARAFDRVVAGEEPEVRWLSGRPRQLPRHDQEGAGRVIRSRTLRDLCRVLAGRSPRDLSEALLVWLVKYGDVGTSGLRRTLFPSPIARLHGGRRLRRVRPDPRAHASPETVETLLAMLRELRPSASVGYLDAPTGP